MATSNAFKDATCSRSGEPWYEEQQPPFAIPTSEDLEDIDLHPDVEKYIEKFQSLGVSAENLNRIGISPIEDVHKMYDEMIYILDELIEIVKNSNNAYQFLKAKGLDRIAAVHLKTDYDELKTRILVLLKVLFHVAPTTTTAVIPTNVVDRLLDIFEDDNLALKAHALDVLYAWLPDNPRVQARVMKVKGLQPFYAQIEKLDTNVIKTLLDLFNKILSEHIKARSEVQRTVIDADKLKFYQRIGLLEHMQTPTVCNGLLNIFVSSWSYNTKENNILMTVFELLKNMKQFCIKVYHGKAKAVNLFAALQEYVKGPENEARFVQNGLNVTDVALVLQDYVEKLKHTVKDEF
ncbi:uncharacterized protein LOC142983404 [Anticarsia gemmatalis]|uniref:uncharacterized protein LOC142983404 n=1 Tax=Anticarsia gemmatalis TaxID=129554 RepID=UPI003F75FE44